MDFARSLHAARLDDLLDFKDDNEETVKPTKLRTNALFTSPKTSPLTYSQKSKFFDCPQNLPKQNRFSEMDKNFICKRNSPQMGISSLKFKSRSSSPISAIMNRYHSTNNSCTEIDEAHFNLLSLSHIRKCDKPNRINEALALEVSTSVNPPFVNYARTDNRRRIENQGNYKVSFYPVNDIKPSILTKSRKALAVGFYHLSPASFRSKRFTSIATVPKNELPDLSSSNRDRKNSTSLSCSPSLHFPIESNEHDSNEDLNDESS